MKPTIPVALITGSARRLGAMMAQALHEQGYCIAIHYRHSRDEAAALCDALNQIRADSAMTVSADLNKIKTLPNVVTFVEKKWGRLDLLINNASEFFPTVFGTTSEEQWNSLINSNLTGAYFLTQAALPLLKKSFGHIINITDINTMRHNGYSAYCIAKAGLEAFTKILAKELAPTVRVNAVAPCAVLPPEHSQATSKKNPDKVIDAILALLNQPKITGTIKKV